MLLDSGEVAYPSGLDWSLHGYGQISYYAWLATHHDDPTARWAEVRLAQHIRERQRLNSDGRFTGEGVPDGFYTEAVKARRVALAYWHHQTAAYPDGVREAPQPFVDHLEDVGLLLQRSTHGFISLSYGKRTMALVVPESLSHPDEPYVVTPRYPSLIGDGAFGPPTKAELTRVPVDPDGFDAELALEYGPLERRHVVVRSTGDALAIIEAPTTRLDLNAPSIAAFPVGIENHALTGGARSVAFAGGDRALKALSGDTAARAGGWACVSDRLGYIVGPGGRVGYKCAAGYNRRGAAEDDLHFVPDDPWLPRYAILLPGASTSETAAVAASVQWDPGGAKARLAFAAPESGKHTLSISLPTGRAPELSAIPVASATSSTSSGEHPPELATDGDPGTFWCSSRDGAIPGHGPSPEQPEWLELRLDGTQEIAAVIVIPRAGYGPKEAVLLIDGAEVWRGTMTHEPLQAELEAPIAGETVRIVMTASHDPRNPDSPRNVQVGEVVVVATAEIGTSGIQKPE